MASLSRTLVCVSLRAARSSSSSYASRRLLSTAVRAAALSCNGHHSNGHHTNGINGHASNGHQSSSSPPLPSYAIKPNLVLGGPRRVHGAEAALLDPEEDVIVKSDLVVVLDMDECLVHSQFFSPHAAKLAHQYHNGNYAVNGNKRVDSFRITLPEGDVVHVHKRPFLEPFLEQVTSRYETHVFTAAMEVYASPVLDRLDSEGKMQRWYRDSCAIVNGAYVKDLDNLPLSNPSRTVLVDNNPISFLTHPENGILVNSFYNDPEDDTLRAVLDLLEELEDLEDVRPALTARFQLKQALEKVQSVA